MILPVSPNVMGNRHASPKIPGVRDCAWPGGVPLGATAIESVVPDRREASGHNVGANFRPLEETVKV